MFRSTKALQPVGARRCIETNAATHVLENGKKLEAITEGRSYVFGSLGRWPERQKDLFMYAASPCQRDFLSTRVVLRECCCPSACPPLAQRVFDNNYLASLRKVLGIVGGVFIDADVVPHDAQLLHHISWMGESDGCPRFEQIFRLQLPSAWFEEACRT